MELSWQDLIQTRFYNPATGWVDGTTEFHRLIERSCIHGGEILEIGAGPENTTTAFLRSLGNVHGLDPDETVMANPDLTTATVLDGATYPFSDESFDTCVSNYVVEHLADPIGHLREVQRVLRPGGAYVFRTVNGWHYVALISRVTPDWVHKLVANRVRALPAETHAPYPTVYAMNSVHKIRTVARAVGLDLSLVQQVEKEPYYGRFSRVVFLLMVLYERVVNSCDYFGPLRANLFVVLRKPFAV
jgi:SAM-dependent methyltransferase